MLPSLSDRWRRMATLVLTGNQFNCIPLVLCHLPAVRC